MSCKIVFHNFCKLKTPVCTLSIRNCVCERGWVCWSKWDLCITYFLLWFPIGCQELWHFTGTGMNCNFWYYDIPIVSLIVPVACLLISLFQEKFSYLVTLSVTLTVTTKMHVGPRPYWIALEMESLESRVYITANQNFCWWERKTCKTSVFLFLQIVLCGSFINLLLDDQHFM